MSETWHQRSPEARLDQDPLFAALPAQIGLILTDEPSCLVVRGER